jgi:hypothetical protein
MKILKVKILLNHYLEVEILKDYITDFKNSYLIFTRRGININEYLSIKKYLSQYKEKLIPKNKGQKIGRKPGKYEWYEIQYTIAYFKEFEKSKIIWQRF